MLLKMTEEDIKQARPCDPWCCPIANCINRTLGKETFSTSVVQSLIVVDKETFTPSFRMRKFMREFDAHLPVRPISFYLRKKETTNGILT